MNPSYDNVRWSLCTRAWSMTESATIVIDQKPTRVYNFSHTRTRPTTISVAKDKYNSCLNRWHTHIRLWVNSLGLGVGGQVHQNCRSHFSSQPTLNLLKARCDLCYLAYHSHYLVYGLYGKMLKYHNNNDRSLTNPSKPIHLDSTPNMVLPCLLESGSSFLFAQLLSILD